MIDSLNEIKSMIEEYSCSFDYSKKETDIILAAGHGKRIKSNTSKMLHKIWQTPTVERVINSCAKGFTDSNIIVVVGIKAQDVIAAIGKRESILFAHQEVQNGTGHAVQMGLEKIDFSKYDGTVYVFPGDMGLIDAETVKTFKNEFEKSGSDMMVLTGLYEGDILDNHYGRIVRAKAKDSKGKSTAKISGNVLEIIEYKDIMNLDGKKQYKIKLGKKEFSYSKKELIENCEYNSGVFAFRFKPLFEEIKKIENNNVQNEIYLTDLISLFNKSGYKVSAVSPREQHVVMGFNTKSVLWEMEKIAQKISYEKVKDIISIEDPNDFFIDESIIEEILELDKQGLPLDIQIGKGAFIGKGVKINYNMSLGRNVKLIGNIHLGKNIRIGDNSRISCFYGQSVYIGDNVNIHMFCTIKGNVSINDDCTIESNVRITGSDELHVKIGKKVTIKGVSYIFGSHIEENIFIEHSVLIKKHIEKPEGIKAEIYKVKYFLPEPEGIKAVKDLK
jgi:bifunctional UDP-N-acetylglucosamine pyrophosphorylase / glucosamine-1-phosphate N-acetyltransferase